MSKAAARLMLALCALDAPLSHAVQARMRRPSETPVALASRLGAGRLKGGGAVVPRSLRIARLSPGHGPGASHASYLQRSGAVAGEAGDANITNHGGMFGRDSLDNFLNLLLQDLPAEQAAALARCGAHLKGDLGRPSLWQEHVDAAAEVWILVVGEDVPPEVLLSWLEGGPPRRRFLVLGPVGPEQLGLRNATMEKYIRTIWVPMASLDFMEQRGHTPMDLVHRGRPPRRDEARTVAYQQQDCAPHREAFWDRLCTSMQAMGRACHALAKCNGHEHLGLQDDEGNEGRASPSRDDNSVERFARYRFVVALESHMSGGGYVTEKIVNPLLAGSVPIYAGSKRVSEVFDPATFVEYDPADGGASAIARVGELLRRPEEYEAMISKPAVTPESLKAYFSWHPSVWPEYGDGLRQRIVNDVLSLCDA